MSSREVGALVVGADGRVGRALEEQLAAAGGLAGVTSRRPGRPGALHLDLAAPPATWPALPPARCAFVCAAVCDLAACRQDPAAAAEVNVSGTVELVARLLERGTFVVWPSTNLVFDGARPRRPAGEETCPTTEYGRQKAAAERALLALGPGVAVVRLTKVVGPGDRLLAGWRRDLAAGVAVHPFADKVMAPVWLPFVAAALRAVAAHGGGGVWQLSAAEDVVYAAAAARLARLVGAPAGLVEPVVGATPETAGEFPVHTTLDTSRLEAELRLRAPDPWAAIERAAGS